MAFTTDAAFPQFLWMAVLAIIFGFTYAFGIGANDVANAFASSVSAKSLTLAQAIFVASTFEFLGAILLGQSVTGTIRSNVLNTEFYDDQASLLMYGMLTSLILATVLLLTATALEFPVSTTHTILAAIVGFSIAALGFQSVNWQETGKIFISWIAAPTISAIISYIFFFCTRKVVLVHDNSFRRAILAFPLVIFAGISVNVAFILLKSEKKISESNEIENFGVRVVLPASVGGGFFCALVFHFIIGPWLIRRVEHHHDEMDEAAAEADRKEEEERIAREEEEERIVREEEEEIDIDEVLDMHAGVIKKEDDPEASETGNMVSSAETSEHDTKEAEMHDQARPQLSIHESIRRSVHQGWTYFAGKRIEPFDGVMLRTGKPRAY